MNKKHGNKNILMGALIAAVILMSVGYAALASQLVINGTSAISSKWDVKFKSISEGTAVGGATNKNPASVTATSATFDVNLVSPGDSMTYTIVVSNDGTLNAKLDSISGLPTSNNDAIKYTVTGVAVNDVLNAGQTATITVKVEYDSSVETQPSAEQLSKSLTVTLNYVQAD